MISRSATQIGYLWTFDHVLSARSVFIGFGAFLLHPTMGWHDPQNVNERYQRLFQFQPIASNEIEAIDRLWILRHSVAHNAGFVTGHDAARIQLPELSNEVVGIDAAFIEEAFYSLCGIAQRLAEQVGDKVVIDWLRSRKKMGKNWKRDKDDYTYLKWLASYVDSRAKDLPKITKGQYGKDISRAMQGQ